MEKTILGKLEWTLTVPTPFVFLVRFIKAASASVSSVSGVPSDQEQELPFENMAHFLSELGMMHYATLKYSPSMVAAAAVFAARCTLNKSPVWNETLKMHTGYSEEQLMDCAKLLTGFHSSIVNGKLKVVRVRTTLFDSTLKNQSYQKSTTTRDSQWLQELFINKQPSETSLCQCSYCCC
ncbi:unnamed protein product [Trifolium pratense]|uniref:Uncharacterized protein n=1 Tax=Trifolium pratense TaxID=57577 RepID=A0ACB0JN46_TRIPR|nr:unnamed protein product [Trifolium pratense]